MTQSAFKNYFSGANSSVPQSSSVSSAPELTLNNISYNNTTRALAVTGSVTDAQGNVKTMSLSGMMYNSYQKEDGVNSTVAILSDSNDHFDVLHFNVFNSTEESVFQFDPTFTGVPHLKVYLLDRDTGDMYFFELNIPQQLSNVSIPFNDDNICPNMLYDMIWFANVVEAETIFEPAAVNSAGDKSLGKFTMKWDSTLGTYYYFTTPIIKYSVNNISNTSTIWDFKFATSDGYCIFLLNI